jgi:cob(I)alamin adenosyltransferase
MKIYTKTGDRGETGLGDGSRVGKEHPRLEVYGTVDELNALLGLCAAKVSVPRRRDQLVAIQGKLLSIGSILANPKQSALLVEDPGQMATLKEKVRLTDEDVSALERFIDAGEAKLKPLKSFILPGGSEAAALLHLARTVCRRAERHLAKLAQVEPLPPPLLRYLNRLGDLLFVWARAENTAAGMHDVVW